jgi:Na+-driven multidrug efflux pump
VAGSLINILLEPILMFTFHFGVSGAAVATVASQYVMAGLLLWNLNKRVVLLPPQLKDLRVNRFLKSGVALYLFDLVLEVTLKSLFLCH